MAYGDNNIGDVQATAVSPIAAATTLLPIVAQADIASATSAINNAAVSGKQLGATVYVNNAGTLEMVYATGSATTDAWNSVDGTAYATPA